MTKGKVRWDVDVLQDSLHTLNAEKENLIIQRNRMMTEHNAVDTNWQSPAGQSYYNRFNNDMIALNDIITQVEKRTNMLKQVFECYSLCEMQVQYALKRLP